MRHHRNPTAPTALRLPVWVVALLIASCLLALLSILLRAAPIIAITAQAPLQAKPLFQAVAPTITTATINQAQSNPATVYISHEEASSRAIVDTQDDVWRVAVQSAQSCTYFQTGLLSETTNTTCGTGKIGDCINPTAFASSQVISYTLRNMTGNGPPLGNPDSWTSGQGDGCAAGGTDLQDGAPRPTNLAGCYYNDAASFRGDNSSANAVLFTFQQPVNAFGAWFGDLETKSPGTNYYHTGKDGGSGTGGALAYLRLVFEDGSIQQAPITPTLAPVTTWLSKTAPPPTAPVGGGGNIGLCGGADDATDADGCGNETTRWVGFVTANPGNRVKQMLVAVGDDDHSGSGPSDGPNVQCSGGSAAACNAGTEYLSFIGPTVCVAPDLTITKSARPDPVVAGGIVTYTLRYHNLVADVATGVVTLTDYLPPSVTYLSTLAANPPATLLNASPQWQVASLPANSTGYLTFTVQIGADMAGLITNTATLATPGELNLSNNQAQQRTLVLQPGLTLRKLTNGITANDPPGPQVLEGDPVTWSYQFTNTGTITLTNLNLTDDRIPNLVCSEGALPGALPPRAIFICTMQGQASAGQYVNQATVTATPTVSGAHPISATARSHYYGLALGRVVVNKVVQNDHGGTAIASDFPLFLNGQPISSGVTETLPAGVYTVTETNLLNYIGTYSGDCSAIGVITLEPGETKRCTLINNDPPPTLGVLTVQKVIVNNDGGSATINDFPLFVNQQPINSGVENLLSPGVYHITESNLPGYAATFSGDCPGDGVVTLAAAEKQRCVLTNDDIAPTLTVHKIVINDNAGTAAAGDFPLAVNNQLVTSGITNTLVIGDYVVSEENLPGYAASFSGDCAADGTITLSLGDHKQCTLTNNDLPPTLATLTINKMVRNDHGGTAQVADFPLFVNGQKVLNGVDQILAPGSYLITETNQTGYAASYSGDCAADGMITLVAGESKVCILTNDDLAPTLTVHKIVVNDNGGGAAASDFPLWINENLVSNGAVNQLVAGLYTISETNRPGYAATFSGDCAADGRVTLPIGATKSCTLTNNDLPPMLGSLTVRKVVVNDQGGSAIPADFALFVNDQPVSNGADHLLPPGAYTVREMNQPGYAATFAGDCTAAGLVTLAAGEHRTCTITNDDVAPTLTLHKLVINNHGGTASSLDFPLFVDNLRVTSDVTTTLAAGLYTVQENDLLGYVGRINGDCAADGRIQLQIGDVKQCTLVNDDTPPSLGILSVRKGVVNDNGGQAQVSDFPLAVNGQPVVSGVENALPPGDYRVSETNLPGYQATFSGDCTTDGVVRLSANLTQVCVITNDDMAPTLTVEKLVRNDDGGRALVSDFPLFVDQQSVTSGVTTILAVGGYQVSERGLPGYRATFSGDCDSAGRVTLALGAVKRCILSNDDHFASLGDRVWNDRNLDGQQADDEPGLADLTVRLYDTQGNLISTTITGPAGDYLFSGLLPGEYVVAFNKTADFVFTTPDQGADSADSDVNPDSGRTSVITLGPSEHRQDIDAGLYQLAALGNFVWNDLNGNGVQEANEPGLGGIWVTLYDANHTAVALTQSNAHGYYGFTDLPPGAYTVQFGLPPEYRFTQANQGDDRVDSDVDPNTGETAIFILQPDETNLTAKAGVLAYPLLGLAKYVNHTRLEITSTATALLTYTLVYSNGGPAPATGVVITETVPPSTTFAAAVSTPGWSCLDGASAGTICLFAVGALPPASHGQVSFALRLSGGIAGNLAINNVARLGDDGANTAQGALIHPHEASVRTDVHAPTSLAESSEPTAPFAAQLYLPFVERGIAEPEQ